MPRLFPIVCAAPLSKGVSRVYLPAFQPRLTTNSLRGQQVMDRFIAKSGVDEDWWALVFVDSIDEYYDEASTAPMESDSDSNSLFIDKTTQECHQLLLKLREDTESEIITNYFIIISERSTQDGTVLLVCVRRNDGDKSAWTIVCIISTRKAGGACVALSQKYPQIRLREIVQAVNAQLILAAPRHVGLSSKSPIKGSQVTGDFVRQLLAKNLRDL